MSAGTFDEIAGGAVVQEVERRHVADIKRCYSAALANDPQLKGELKIELTIEPTGKVARGIATGIDAMQSCVEAVVVGWKFATPKDLDGKTAKAPFVVQFRFKLVAS